MILRKFSEQEHEKDTTFPSSVLLWNLSLTKYIMCVFVYD